MAARESVDGTRRSGAIETWRDRCLSGPNALGCYMVKPHGQLGRVSCIHYWTSTPRLSTS